MFKNWRRTIGWTLAILGALIFAVIAGGLLYLKSASFQQFAIRTITQSVNAASGGRAEIGRLDFQPLNLTAHLYDITIHGTESSTEPPVLHLDKLTVGLKIQSLLNRKVTLSELGIEHPVAHIRVDRNGNSNIPHAAKTQSTGNTSIFDLAAGHVLLSNGEINYNDATTPLDADLYGLRAEIHFEWLDTRYRGKISYTNGRLRYANESPLAHSLQASFNATPSRFSLESAILKLGSSDISINAELTNYSNPAVEGRYAINLHTQDFSGLSQPVTPAGDVALSGTIHYQNVKDRTLLESLSIEGGVTSDVLVIAASEGRVDIRTLRGRYRLMQGRLQAHALNFEVLGGKVKSDIDAEHLDGAAQIRIRTAVTGVSLQAAQKTLRSLQNQRETLVSAINGTIDASWTGSVNNIQAQADLTLRSQAAGDQYNIPVNGSIHASYNGPQNSYGFHQTTLRFPAATIALEGQVSDHSNLQIQAGANDLRQLAPFVLALVNSDTRGGETAPMNIAGSATLQALVQGPMRRPSVEGQLNAQNLRVQGSEWKSATIKFQADPTQVVVQNAVLVDSRQGKASLSAKVGLQNWSYRPSNPLSIDLSVDRLPVTDLQKLGNVRYPISGDLSAEVSFHGSQLNPAGSGTARIDNAQAYGEAFQRLAATFRGDKSSLTSTLEVVMAAGSATGSISYNPGARAYRVSLDAPSVALQKLQTVQAKNLGLSGVLAFTASGEGTLDNPQLTATVAVPQLQLRDKSISEIKGAIRVANQKANISFDSQVAQATVHSHGTVNIDRPYYAEAAIDTTGVPLDPLLAMFLTNVPPGFHGETELHGTFKGPLNDRSKIEAHLTIPTLKASYQSMEIGAASPIRMDYAGSVITIQPAEIRGTGTSLQVEGKIPLGGETAPSLNAKGSVDARIIRILQPDIQSSGIVVLDLKASGSAKVPTVQGQVRLQNIAFSSEGVPLGVQNLNGMLNLNNETLQIANLSGEVGGGEMSLAGSISYRPNLQFNVIMQSHSVRLLYPDGLRTMLDGNLTLSGTKDASTLNGRVLIDSLSFTPDFDLAKFSDQFSGSSVPAQPGLADNVRLAVAVQSKGNLSASNSQLSLEGQVNLQVIGTAANPVIIGRTDITRGELFYRNIRYELDRGVIAFDNPSQIDPVLNVSVHTTVQQYNLTLTMRGTFDKLMTSYTSDPPLATADVINLIARGKTTQEQNATSQSTDSILASQAASRATNSIQQLAGISALQIDPLLGGNNQNPSARVAIQQRVTKNFLFTFSTDLSQPGTEVVQGDYQINKRWSVTLTRNEVGGISVDGKYHTRF